MCGKGGWLLADGRWHLAQNTGNLCSQRQWAKSSGALYPDALMKPRPPVSRSSVGRPGRKFRGAFVFRPHTLLSPHTLPPPPARSFKHTDTSNRTRGLQTEEDLRKTEGKTVWTEINLQTACGQRCCTAAAGQRHSDYFKSKKLQQHMDTNLK